MKMDRNINPDGRGKYAVLNLRTNRIEWGCVGDEDEFFLIKLKDRNAKAALLAYADAIAERDPEFAAEVRQIAQRAGPDSPFCKDPD
jgi:hypothetical protein